METLVALFGTEGHVAPGQECARAVLIFVYGLVLLRLSGRRTFAHWSAVDIIMSIIVGSTLSRALTGSAPLPGTMAAAAVLVLLHLAAAYAVAASRVLSRLIEGPPIMIARDGLLDNARRLWHTISHADIEEALRSKQLKGLEDMPKVKQMTLEANGKLSVLKE